jgi:hypothetical protein
MDAWVMPVLLLAAIVILHVISYYSAIMLLAFFFIIFVLAAAIPPLSLGCPALFALGGFLAAVIGLLYIGWSSSAKIIAFLAFLGALGKGCGWAVRRRKSLKERANSTTHRNSG